LRNRIEAWIAEQKRKASQATLPSDPDAMETIPPLEPSGEAPMDTGSAPEPAGDEPMDT